MRRVLFMLMGITLLPAMASATYLVEPNVEADCIGYNADFMVDWHPAVDEIMVEIVVTIVDPTETELFRYTYTDVLTRGDGEGVSSFHFDAMWNDVTDEIIPLFGFMDIRADLRIFFPEDSPYWSPSTDGKTATFEDTLECAVVPNDDLSWSTLKTQYR